MPVFSISWQRTWFSLLNSWAGSMRASHLPYKGLDELTGLSKTQLGRWVLLLLGLTAVLMPVFAVSPLSQTTSSFVGVVLAAIAGVTLGVVAALKEDWWEQHAVSERMRQAINISGAILVIVVGLGVIRDLPFGWAVFSGAVACAGAALATSAGLALRDSARKRR
jgi:hypothetical protein